MNGAYFNSKEYKPLVNELINIFHEFNEKPTIIFDLKGPIPRIVKLYQNQTSLTVEKGQILKLTEEKNKEIDQNDLIYLDKNIISSIRIGDTIIIDGTKCFLKVIGFERQNFKKVSSMSLMKNFITKEKGIANIKSQQALSSSFLNESETLIYDEADHTYENQLFSINEQLDFNIKEEDYLQGFNNNVFEGESTEIIKDRQSNIEEEFKSFLEKNKKPSFEEKTIHIPENGI